MTEQEMLALLQKVIEPVNSKLESLDIKIDSLDKRLGSVGGQMDSLNNKVNTVASDVSGIKIILENEIRRDIKLLAEGHASILEHLPYPEEQEALETRVDALESIAKLHSKQIRELKKAQ